MSNSRPHILLQECAVTLVTDHRTNWHEIVKHNSISVEEHDMYVFQSTLIMQCSFLPRWRLGKPFGILSFQLRVKWMHALLVNSLNKFQECTSFISLMPQMGGGKNTHGSLVIVEHVWNPLCTDFSFTQAVGEDTISTCWRNSICRNNCRAWHTESTFKDRFYFPCGLHPSPILGLHWEGHHPSFPAIFNDHHPSASSVVWRSLCPYTFLSKTCNTLQHFYRIKHKILLIFSHPSARNSLVVFPDPQLNSSWHHKDSAPL